MKSFKIGLLIIVASGVFFAVNADMRENRVETAGQASIRVAVSSSDDSLVRASDTPLLQDELPAGLVIGSRIAYIRELESDRPLLAYHTEIFWPIASMTKLMTAVVAEEVFGEDKKIVATESALSVEGTAGRIVSGGRYTSWDLMKSMLTVSSNDAAQVLAEAYDESMMTPEAFAATHLKDRLFVEKMNEKAKELGMNDTFFGDSTGLSMNNQSTAGDLYKLVIYISKRYPDLLRVTRQKSNSFVNIKTGKRETLTNINLFAGRADFSGGKTGHTPEAGDNLLSVFSYNGKQYMILVCGASDRFSDTTILLEWLKQQL